MNTLAETVTIASGAAVSGALSLRDNRGTGRITGLLIPASWTTAALTFQGSLDGENFFDIYDASTERTVASGAVVADHFLSLDPDLWDAFPFIKVRSGTAASPVNQAADRTLTFAVQR